MKYPFLLPAVSFGLGILFYAASPSVEIRAAFFFLVPLLFLSCRKIFFPVWLCLFWIGIGFLSAKGQQTAQADSFYTLLNQGPRRISAIATVLEEPQAKKRGQGKRLSLVVKTRKIKPEGRRYQKQRGKLQVFVYQPAFVPRIGDEIYLWGTLERPRRPKNEGEFDYGQFLARRGIHAVFTVIGKKSMRFQRPPPAFNFVRETFHVRRFLSERMESLFRPQYAPLFQALILGVRQDLSPSLYQDLIKTGTSHLIAISGLNISMFAGSIYLLLILCRVPQKGAAVLALIIAVFQIFLAGFGPPVERAGWMAGLGFLALLFERPRDNLNALYFAFLLLLWLNPQAIYSISFQLSFLSVWALIVLLKDSASLLARWEWMKGSLAVMAGTFPMALYHFNIFSPASLVANLAAIPLFHLALLSSMGALFASFFPGIGYLPARAAEFLLGLALQWIHFCSILPGAYFYLRTPEWHQILLYYLSGALAWLIYLRRGKWQLPLGVWGFALAAFFIPVLSSKETLTLFAANRIVLAHYESPGRQWLINTGGLFPVKTVDKWVLPYLSKKGINRIEGVVITDDAKKHWAGYAALRTHFLIERWLYPASIDFYFRKFRRTKPLPSGWRLVSVSKKNQAVFIKERLFLISKWDGVLTKQYEKNRKTETDILVLPAEVPLDRNFEKMIDISGPKAVIQTAKRPDMAAFLKDRDILYYDLESCGMLSLEFPETGNGLFKMKSFLKGDLGAVAGY